MKILRAVYVFSFTLLIYLGLCLLGWGLTDISDFFADSTRLAYALIIAVFALLVGTQSYHSLAAIQDGKEETGQRIRRQTIIGSMLVVSLFTGLFLIPFSSRHEWLVFPELTWLAWIRAACSASGYWLVYWSGLALGRQYSAEVTLQKGHQLITTGPYRLIRHPRYLGILFIALGLTLVFHSWLGLLFTMVANGLILFRIHDEEKLLQEHFGKQWEDYCRKSWRLVPYLY
jgi:protein-S-isoprenylcysteine O-methyltransferase Ste14